MVWNWVDRRPIRPPACAAWVTTACGVIGGNNGDDCSKSELSFPMRQGGRRRLIGIALTPIVSSKGKTQVNILQGLAFDQPADSNGFVLLFQRHQIQAKSHISVHHYRPIEDVAFGIANGSYALVTDMPQPGEFVDQPKDEGSVVCIETTDDEPLGYRNVHRPFSAAPIGPAPDSHPEIAELPGTAACGSFPS